MSLWLHLTSLCTFPYDYITMPVVLIQYSLNHSYLPIYPLSPPHTPIYPHIHSLTCRISYALIHDTTSVGNFQTLAIAE